MKLDAEIFDADLNENRCKFARQPGATINSLLQHWAIMRICIKFFHFCIKYDDLFLSLNLHLLLCNFESNIFIANFCSFLHLFFCKSESNFNSWFFIQKLCKSASFIFQICINFHNSIFSLNLHHLFCKSESNNSMIIFFHFYIFFMQICINYFS